jgi:hypothetical protein
LKSKIFNSTRIFNGEVDRIFIKKKKLPPQTASQSSLIMNLRGTVIPYHIHLLLPS